MSAVPYKLGFEPYLDVTDMCIVNTQDFITNILKYNGFKAVSIKHSNKVNDFYNLWLVHRMRFAQNCMKVYGHLILNKKHSNTHIDKSLIKYMGRGTIFGNNYTHLPNAAKIGEVHYVSTREHAVAHYANTFRNMWKANSQFKLTILSHRGKYFECYCAPELCHCVYAVALANKPPFKLNIKTQYGAKDQLKADIAQSFIGIGVQGSSTDSYRMTYGLMANKLNYAKDEYVFVSINGNRAGCVKIDAIKIYLDAAIQAKVRFVTDDPSNRSRAYNSGERDLANYLQNAGYIETVSANYSIWSFKEV
jgi:hypothetical protein